jgi:hypothetical protein
MSKKPEWDVVICKKPVTIELEPTEYKSDLPPGLPKKREPFFGSGALEWGVFILSWVVTAAAVHFLGLR